MTTTGWARPIWLAPQSTPERTPMMARTQRRPLPIDRANRISVLEKVSPGPEPRREPSFCLRGIRLVGAGDGDEGEGAFVAFAVSPGIGGEGQVVDTRLGPGRDG